MWKVGIFETRTGEPQLMIPVADGSTWETRIKGNGRGLHLVPLHNAGIPQSMIRELSLGNKYTIAQMWDDHVAFAGVIQNRKWLKKSRLLRVKSAELRAAYMDSRMLHGVPSYDPAGTTLTVSGKSHSGAARAVINAPMAIGSVWELPIDLPADGSGGFYATWKHNERLNWEDYLSQVEDDGCEIFFRPYLDGDGWLRWETLVADKIEFGTATDLPIDAPDSRVLDLEVEEDFVKQMTGLLGFGKSSTLNRWQGNYAVDISVRDVWVTFEDITDGGRLQAAVDAMFARLELKTEQWLFGLDIFPDGPEFTAPGRTLNLWSYGDEFIPDGKHQKRVVAVRGDMGMTVAPEVQDGA